MSNFKDKEALKDWQAHKQSIERATVINNEENHVEKKKRIDKLIENPEEFAKYYFPHYCSAGFAKFHKRFLKHIVKNDRAYVTNKWSRDHAKSVITNVVSVIYLKCTKQMRNLLLVSHTETNAIDLITPLKLEFESNLRLLNDFGAQVNPGNWEASKFVTMDGCSFRALGAGQSPRGTKNQEARPDLIIVDDIDTEELCRNSKRLDDLWEWVTGALYGCFSIKGRKRFIVVGNKIAVDCIVERAVKQSDFTEQVDILRKEAIDPVYIRKIKKEAENIKGRSHQDIKILQECVKYAETGYKPSWDERFTLFDCVYMIIKMGYRMSQREYFNNPLIEGKTFKKDWWQFKALPPLKEYKYLVAYLDPGFKNTSTADSKCLVLMALHKSELHIRKVFCGRASVVEMIGWCYSMDEFVKSRNGAYKLKMEEVFLQDLLYKEFSAVALTKGFSVPVSGDKRKKPDKDSRIESISGYWERGDVYVDENIKDDHHFMAYMEQFNNFEPGVKTLKDAPDATEGCIFILNQNRAIAQDITIGNYTNNKHKM